ncbi:S8 family peptidase [Psychrobacillus psychrotolerans]|uniref:S8 family peptidase n=1 Tax=Psychrobacillus psychrotolerans TaxID=126156 RepID=UPI003C782F59
MLKEYIVELEKPFDSSIDSYFTSKNCSILFHDELLPELIILETTEDISTFEFIDTYNEPRIGEILHTKKSKKFKTIELEPELNSDFLHSFGYGFGVKIAILDTGIDNDICPDVKEAVDFTGTGTDPKISHGSIVTRIIKSFSRAAEVYSAKVSHEEKFKESNVYQALKWAKEKDVDIINMSIGIACDCDGSCPLSRYINALVDKCGILFVAAAGNDFEAKENTFSKRVHCPACSLEVISVGSLSKDGLDVAQFSVPGIVNSDKPNIVAPGHGNLNTLRYATPFRGTSFAAPVITGILGCLVSYIPTMDITVETDLVALKKKKMHNLKMNLYETTTYLEKVYASRQGFGKLDLEKLLEVLHNEKQSNSRGQAN